MAGSLSFSNVAAIGVVVGALLVGVAYIAFLVGMSALAEMGRLAKLKRQEFEAPQFSAERTRQAEQTRLREAQRERDAAVTATPTASRVSSVGSSAKVPWWKYETRRR